MNRIAILHRQADRHVSRFMHGSRIALVFIHHEPFALGAHQDAIARRFNVFTSDGVRIIARGRDGRLVQQIGQIGAGKAGRAARYPLEFEFMIERDGSRVHFQNCFATSQVSQVNHDLAVEPSRACQSVIEDVRTISRSDDHDTG